MINSYNPVTFQLNAAYNGVSAANRLMFIINFFWIGLTAAISIFISQFFGANNRKKIVGYLQLSVFVTIIFGIISFLIIYFLGPVVVKLFLPNSNDSYLLGSKYIKIISYGAIVMLANMMLSTIFRSIKRQISALIAGVIGIGINIFLNYLLIFGNLGVTEMGVEGAALATVISKLVEFGILLIIAVFFSKEKYLFDLFKSFEINKKIILEYIKKGLPILASEVVWALGILIYVRLITRGNEYWYLIYGYAQNIMDLFYVFFSGLATGTAILIGSTLGAGDLEKAKDYSYKLKGLTFILSVINSILLVGLSPAILLIFKSSKEVYLNAYYLLIVTSVFIPIYAYNAVCYFILRSGGDSLRAFLLDQLPTYLIGLPILVLFSVMSDKWHIGLIMLFVISKICDLTKIYFSYYYVKKGKWLKTFD